MSRGITTTILAGLLLTSCVTARGCGGSRARDTAWYDAHGHRVSENWKVDPTGKRVPDPHPYDRYGRPWVYDENGNLVPQDPPPGTRRRSGGGLFFWGGSGYRSGSSGTSYSPGRSGGGPSSISRGGFGSTGMGGGG